MSNNENSYEYILDENIYKTPRKGIKGFKDNWGSFTLIVFLIFTFRSVVIEPFKIPSGSMIPTLLIGDFVLVNKMSYGLKLPFSHWIGDPIYLYKSGMPKRGDVVVFKYPKDTSFNYVKRLIGEPGDKIEVINKVVYVNDTPISMEPIKGETIMEDMDEKFKEYNLRFFKTQTGDIEHISQIDEDNGYLSDFGPVVVPDGHYFVMGDNRDYSSDSRIWGYVPYEHIKGKAVFIWFSWSFPWPWTIGEEQLSFRPWRIGLPIK